MPGDSDSDWGSFDGENKKQVNKPKSDDEASFGSFEKPKQEESSEEGWDEFKGDKPIEEKKE